MYFYRADLIYLICKLDHPKSSIQIENGFSQCTEFPCDYAGVLIFLLPFE